MSSTEQTAVYVGTVSCTSREVQETPEDVAEGLWHGMGTGDTLALWARVSQFTPCHTNRRPADGTKKNNY